MKAEVNTKQDSSDKTGFRIALLVSLFLHLCVLGFAYQFSFAMNNISEKINERSSIEVKLGGFNSQFPEPTTLDMESAGLVDRAVQAESLITEGQTIEEGIARLAGSVVVPAMLQPIHAGEESANAELNSEQTLSAQQQAESTSGSGVERLTTVGLQNSVASFMQEYRQDLNQNWLEECARYKKQYATKDCPYGEDYVATLNPVRLQPYTNNRPSALAPGKFSAQDSFRMMTQEDLFNPNMLSGNIPIFSLGGGGVLNVGISFIRSSFGLTRPHEKLLFSVQEPSSVAAETEAASEGDFRQGFFIRPSLF